MRRETQLRFRQKSVKVGTTHQKCVKGKIGGGEGQN